MVQMYMSSNSTSEETRVVRYRIPFATSQSELVVRKSVFIGTLTHASNVQAAQDFVAQMQEQYANANHNAWAYKIGGFPQAIIGSSDDGEPGGTAGRPMLAVLEGSDLCEIAAVVTRYFGGIKLGTGGAGPCLQCRSA